MRLKKSLLIFLILIFLSVPFAAQQENPAELGSNLAQRDNQSLKEKLAFIDGVKEYSQEILGLVKIDHHVADMKKVKNLYALFAISREKLASNQQLMPHRYMFNDKDKMEEFRQIYERNNLDTFWTIIEAHQGTKGEIVILPSLLRASKANQAQAIIHEEIHATIDLPENLEESIANVIGLLGAIEFTKTKFGENSPEYQEAIWQFQEKQKRADFVCYYYYKLENILNNQALSDTKKESERTLLLIEANTEYEELNKKAKTDWLKNPHGHKVNNAFLSFYITYDQFFNLILGVYEKSGEDLLKTIEVLKKASLAPNALKYLMDYLYI